MKTSEERDAMVTRVQDAFAKWPALDQMPDDAKLSKGASIVTVDVVVTPTMSDSDVQTAYVYALYELSHKGATPIGRMKDKAVVVGELFEAARP